MVGRNEQAALVTPAASRKSRRLDMMRILIDVRVWIAIRLPGIFQDVSILSKINDLQGIAVRPLYPPIIETV